MNPLLSILLQVPDLGGDNISFVKLLFAVTPVLCLIVLMGFLKIAGHKSALITLATTVIIALFAFKYPVQDTGIIVAYGVFKAIFPILVIILMAIFSYNVLVHTNKMEVIKSQFSSISSDKCIQVLLLTWGFGGLLEGMAGFGTAVAIPAAILISLGFKPMFAAVTSLIANSVPTAFGAVGIPVIVLGDKAGIENIQELSTNVVVQLSPLMFLIPLALVFMTDPRIKSLPKHILISLYVGAISLGSQYFAARYIGPETPAILGSLASIIGIVIYGKLTAPKEDKVNNTKLVQYTTKETVKAWSVYCLILFLVILTSPLLPFKDTLKEVVTTISLTAYDSQSAMSVSKPVSIYWLVDAGFLLFIGSMIGGLIQGAKLGDLFKLLGKTLKQLKKTIITVSCLIALSSLMDVSGMILEIGIALAIATGSFYPLFAPTIGCLGTFLTGSDTSSNILFGKLQTTVAAKLQATGVDADPSWLAAANTTGATGGKIISPQSIAVATTACEQQGKEGEILKKAFPFALGYIIIAGLMVYFFG